VKRLDWEHYWLGVARAVAARADCTRRQVGAVIVGKYERIVSTGYNGSPPGGPSCLEGECPRGRHYLAVRHGTADEYDHCACGDLWPCSDAVQPGSSYDSGPGTCHALHAEQNAIIWASPERLAGAVLYVTSDPCDGCLRLIAGVGITRIVSPA
jgi:dCMP deaminase